MARRAPDAGFWNGRRVLLTGHTGFKGAWATIWLNRLGAKVTGFSLAPEDGNSLYAFAAADTLCQSRIGDLRNPAVVDAAIRAADPEIIIHMAAQALVRPAVADPCGTVATNVLGTMYLLDAARRSDVKTIVIVTSDKVYQNDGSGRAFAEDDCLGGSDPYSASKAACDIVAQSFSETYLATSGVRMATARGGNVIGGGDYAVDRIVPDIVRAARSGQAPILRMPGAVRPWQHVLDCVSGYLLYAEDLHMGRDVPSRLNFGPREEHPVTVGELTTQLLAGMGQEATFISQADTSVHEMHWLQIDASRARQLLGWDSQLSTQQAIDWTASWYRDVESAKDDARLVTERQIDKYYDHCAS